MIVAPCRACLQGVELNVERGLSDDAAISRQGGRRAREGMAGPLLKGFPWVEGGDGRQQDGWLGVCPAVRPHPELDVARRRRS